MPDTLSRSGRRLPALLLALGLGVGSLGACAGGDDSGPGDAGSSTGTPSPTDGGAETPDVEVPEGVELTEAGTELGFGDTGTVPFEAGPDRSTVLGITVDGVREGRVGQLSAFQLDEATRASTPYYVRVTVRNEGTGDLGGVGVPLFVVDQRDVLIQPSSFTTSFERCPSTPLPEEFGAGEQVETCLVYLVPEAGEELAAVSFRPLQSVEAVTWTGDVRPPAGSGD